jgi:tungstate transport system ATP-binding protein
LTCSTLLKATYTLEASELSVVLGGKKVLEVSTIHVVPGEVLVVVGPNGSGKTTLLLALALLLKPATGTISYKGCELDGSSDILKLRRQFAVVFQDPLLLNASVWDNVTLGLRLRGVEKPEIKKRTQKWLSRFGVESLAGRQARTLSGGEAKRVSLARAFALQPEVLFLDEPFVALDSPTRQLLIGDFESVLRETEVSTIMVSHDRNEAIMLASRIAVLINGSIRQVGTPEDIFASPVDEEVASFVEEGNIIHGVISSQSSGLAAVDVAGRTLYVNSDLMPGAKISMFLRHEVITISLPSVQAVPSSARNNIEGKVVKSFSLGSQMRITLDCGFPLVVLVTRRSWEELGLEVGKAVIASFKASSIHIVHHH